MADQDKATCMRCGGSGVLVTGSRLTYEERPCEVCRGTGQASNGGYGKPEPTTGHVSDTAWSD